MLEEAKRLDKIGIANWTGHPHLRVINNATNFEEKMHRLITEVFSHLGEPAPFEIERKYLIKYPSLDKLSHHVSFSIIQTYLTSSGNVERRVRQRGQNGNFSYYLTRKREIDSLKRAEVEKKISEKDYLRYLIEMDTSLSPLIKKRVCFVYNGQYFEMDLFNFSKDLALMEIELASEESTFDLPDFIHVIKEVTDAPYYKNKNLAQS